MIPRRMCCADDAEVYSCQARILGFIFNHKENAGKGEVQLIRRDREITLHYESG